MCVCNRSGSGAYFYYFWIVICCFILNWLLVYQIWTFLRYNFPGNFISHKQKPNAMNTLQFYQMPNQFMRSKSYLRLFVNYAKNSHIYNRNESIHRSVEQWTMATEVKSMPKWYPQRLVNNRKIHWIMRMCRCVNKWDLPKKEMPIEKIETK